MNAPALPAPDAGHLDSPLLEALAAHAAPEDEHAFARQHLDVCERCRTELAALEAENAAFGDFFAAEEARLAPRFAPSRREGVYRLATVLASGLAAMLALALVWEKIGPGSGNRPSETPALAEEGKTPPQEPEPVPQPRPEPVTPPEVAPTPAPQTPNPGQGPVYRGRTAAEWITEIESKDLATLQSAMHALTVLGSDAVPILLSNAAKCSENKRNLMIDVLCNMDDPKAIPLIQKGLSDPNWGVRIVCAKALEKAAQDDLAVAESLKRLKNDPDKAVVEAVEGILQSLPSPNAIKAKALIRQADACLDKGDYSGAIEALKAAQEVKDLTPSYRTEILNRLRQVETWAKEKVSLWAQESKKLLEEGKFAEAAATCKHGLNMAPNDPELLSLLKFATDGLRAAEKKRTSVGESDLPTTDTKR